MDLRLWKTILSTALASALTVSSAIPALAANGDIYDKTNKVTYASADYNSNTAVYNQLINQLIMGQGLNRFTYEFNNLKFNFDQYNAEVTRLIATNLSPIAAKTAAAAEPGLLDQVGSGTVTSVTAITDINVPTGTNLSALGLPTTVNATLSSGTTALSVTWDAGTPAYLATTPGTYVFSGTLTMPSSDITNPNNVKASVKVIVTSSADFAVIDIS